jgi:hypothetical protein
MAAPERKGLNRSTQADEQKVEKIMFLRKHSRALGIFG